jgi:hypothetical protein
VFTLLIVHILLGILLAFVIWKLLKITLKTAFWLFLIGLVVAVVSPAHLHEVKGVGFLILSVLGGLLLMSIAGFFFLDDQ